MEQEAIKSSFFVAVITDEFLAKREKYLLIIKTMAQENERATFEDRTRDLKPMYVIVKRGVKWRAFQDFHWRQIYFYTTDKEFDAAFDKVKQDVKNWKRIQS